MFTLLSWDRQMKYRISKDIDILDGIPCIAYKVQVRVFFLWLTIKKYLEEYQEFHYAENSARNLLELLQQD